ncbi:MAG: OmpA family protein [Syntrophales bacterium LBB04]|nr:OmpA family protein [Syntrophales bacterium LBB04]
MEERSRPIIVKRKKKGHAAAHGGAWKVAYADFVTAMMAFFLVMWLLAMASPAKKAALSEYFNNYSIFPESGSSFMGKSAQVLTQPDKDIKESTRIFFKGKGGGGLSSEDLVKKLKDAIDEKLKSVKNQVLVDIIEGGVRVQIIDSGGSLMFPLGSAEPTGKAREILRLVADNIASTPNRIAIEGHTDAAPFKGAQTTNWELSTARASAARRELENDGIETSRIARVVGYADQELYVPEDPRDPRNRRISIILLQSSSASQP